MDKLLELRDALQLMVDQAMLFVSDTPEQQHSDRVHLAALAEAWMILDQEVTRLAEEE